MNREQLIWEISKMLYLCGPDALRRIYHFVLLSTGGTKEGQS